MKSDSEIEQGLGPCRKCSKLENCNTTCQKLEDFMGSDRLKVGSYGVSDTTDETGYCLGL